MKITNDVEQQRCLMNSCIDDIESCGSGRDLMKHINRLYLIANEVYARYGCDPSCSVLGDCETFETLMVQAQTLKLICKIYGTTYHELKKFTKIKTRHGVGSRRSS